MIKLEISSRVKDIEGKFNAPIKDLLYQMHWLEDMKHRDIALNLHTPRPTLTRWFHHFKIPTQSCRRFTDKNLTSWLYKTGQLKKKACYIASDKRLNRTRRGLNIDFFKKWSQEMAYILGYFAADGSMYVNPRGSKYITFSSIDRELLEKVKHNLNSKHKIALRKRYNENWKDSFTFQIGSKEMYSDLIKLGFMQHKARRFHLPKAPKKYMSHFIRGYFDGDGSVTRGYFKRKDRNNKMTPYLLTCFASANYSFLKEISVFLKKNINMGKGCINKKSGHLNYSKMDSIKLFEYMYKDVPKALYLQRKYIKFQKAIN